MNKIKLKSNFDGIITLSQGGVEEYGTLFMDIDGVCGLGIALGGRPKRFVGLVKFDPKQVWRMIKPSFESINRYTKGY